MSRTVCGICWCPYDDDTGACGCEPAPKEQHTSTLREAAQQALEALWYYHATEFRKNTHAGKAIAVLQAALAEPVEPVARECRDPMCACRGGPCAECEEGKREKEIEDLRSSLYFYRCRCEALQSWQSKMRDPERTIVCDILANGKTLDAAFDGDRYTPPPQRKPWVGLTEEEIYSLFRTAGSPTAFARAIERAHGIGGNT